MGWAHLRQTWLVMQAMRASRRAIVDCIKNACDPAAVDRDRIAVIAGCFRHLIVLFARHGRPPADMPREVLAAERRGVPYAR